MKIKLENGNAVLRDGNPVYIKEDGNELVVDAAQLFSSGAALRAEAKQWREKFEAADTSLKSYEGMDAKAAQAALETVSKLDQKQLLDAGKVDEIKAAMAKSFEAKLSDTEGRAAKLEAALKREVIGGAFARSSLIAERLVIPVDIVEATFGRHFEIVDEQLVAKDLSGNPIYSATDYGKPASFDEALEKIIEAYPHKDKILKGVGAAGAGTQQSQQGGRQTNGKGDFGGDLAARTAAMKSKFPELPLN
jgi:hypothetical protein